MPITASQILYARRSIGDKPDDTVLGTIYNHYDGAGETEPIEWTILHVLETRYANMVGAPSSFTIPGDYGQTIGAENFKALEKMIARQRAYMAGLGIEIDGAGTASMTVVLPEDHVYQPRLR